MSKLPNGYTMTSRKPVIVDGVTFNSYRTGICRYELITLDANGDIAGRVSRNEYRSRTYSASANCISLGTRFRSERGACIAVVKALRARGPRCDTVGRDPHELGWKRDIIGQSGDRSGRTWIKPDGSYFTFAPGVRMVVFEAPAATVAGVK